MTTTRPEELHRVPLIRGLVDLVVAQEVLSYDTGEYPDFMDITADVKAVVATTGCAMGIAILYSRHTTAAVVLQERESLLLQDFKAYLERLAPQHQYYGHNDFDIRTENMNPDESPNAHSHCLHMMMGGGQFVPINNGSLDLGQWKSIFLVELDKPRRRELVVQVYGLTGVQGQGPNTG